MITAEGHQFIGPTSRPFAPSFPIPNFSRSLILLAATNWLLISNLEDAVWEIAARINGSLNDGIGWPACPAAKSGLPFAHQLNHTTAAKYAALRRFGSRNCHRSVAPMQRD